MFRLGGAPDEGLTKSGIGTLALPRANTYTGGTSVSAGSLAINGFRQFHGCGGWVISLLPLRI